MSAPVFPKSAAPNRWLSASIAGSTLTGSDITRDQLAANAVNVTLVGGALDDTYIAYGTSTNVVEQANGGIDTVITWGNSYTLGANVENLTLMGGANSTATGNTGNNILTGNDGNNRIVTGGGNDLLVGSKGADTYVPTEAANSVTWIAGFKASGTTIDKIDLRGFGMERDHASPDPDGVRSQDRVRVVVLAADQEAVFVLGHMQLDGRGHRPNHSRPR